MIYVYSKPDMIILSDRSRDLKQDLDEYEENDVFKDTNLLFTLDIDFNDSYIRNNLRRWIILDSAEKDSITCYKNKPIIIDWLRNIKDEGVSQSHPLNYTPKLVLESEKNNIINNFLQTKSFLVQNHIVSDEEPKDTNIKKDMLKYNCDVYNYLEEVYPKLVNIILEYTLLGEKKKTAIQEFYRLKTRENQMSYLRSNGNIEVADLVDFLPDWCIFGLLISEDCLRKSNEKSDADLPEFKNKKKIDDKDFLRRHKDILVRNEIFKSFGINEIWTGAQIKSKIREIYSQFEYTEGKPRISEINKYFEVNKTRQGYRIGFRKLTKYN